MFKSKVSWLQTYKRARFFFIDFQSLSSIVKKEIIKKKKIENRCSQLKIHSILFSALSIFVEFEKSFKGL